MAAERAGGGERGEAVLPPPLAYLTLAGHSFVFATVFFAATVKIGPKKKGPDST